MKEKQLSFDDFKKYNKDDLINLLDKSDLAVIKAVIAIMKLQTKDEIISRKSIDHNGVGFSRIDTKHMHYIVDKINGNYENIKILSQTDIIITRNKIKKYWRQLLKIANKGRYIS